MCELDENGSDRIGRGRGVGGNSHLLNKKLYFWTAPVMHHWLMVLFGECMGSSAHAR